MKILGSMLLLLLSPACLAAEAPAPTDVDVPRIELASTDSKEASSQITVYVTDWCGYCRKTERLLDQLEVPYETVDVEKIPGAKAEKNRIKPGCGVPVTVIAEESICGYSERRIRDMVEELKKSTPESGNAENTGTEEV